MDYTNFVNRINELTTLKNRLKSDNAELIVVYGKRRVGKTELLNQLGMIYILFRQESEQNQLKRMSESLGNSLKDEFLVKNPFNSWDSFFTYIEKKDLQIAFDEFPYAVDANPSLPSILQDHWDSKLRHTKTKIILCGSSISMMESLLGYKSPIYGRRTAQVLVEPMDFKNSTLFYNVLSAEEKIMTYSILGGTPAYILEFDYKKNTPENIKEKVLKRDSFLYAEVDFLLKEELKEPRTYFSILSAIALGKTALSEIMGYSGYDKGTITRYLSILSDLHLISREVPITEKSKEKSRKGRYILKDNYLKFWFRYIFQNMEYLNVNKADELHNKIEADLNLFVSTAFEDVCREYVSHSLKEYILVGSWWEKEEEIDIVAINEDKKSILFGECKWSKNLIDTDVYEKLKEKSRIVNWHLNDRAEKFCIFSRKGFTEKMKTLAKEEGVLLFTPDDLV